MQKEALLKTPWHKKPGGLLFIHFLRTVLVGFILGPLASSLAAFSGESAIALPLALLCGFVCGRLCLLGRELPLTLAGRYVLPLCFIWVLALAFFPFALLASLSGAVLSALRFLPGVYILGLLAGYVFFERRRADKVRFSAWAWAIFVFLLLPPLIYIGHGVHQDRTYAAKRGHGFERAGGFSSTDLKPYDPRVPDALTPRLETPAAFSIRGTDKLPVLDGAEAAFPVYAAFAAACYPDLPPLSARELQFYDDRNTRTGALTFTNTIYAFKRLLDGKADIFFGARPSAGQLRQAADNGKELLLTPIGRDAFVFFVNAENPVNALTAQQIRDIYSGRVRNWRELGGRDAEIIAFQRPENSGSQSVMRAFMGETEMEEPLRDRYVGGMGGIAERTSEYRNAPSAIVYSFLFFLSGPGKQPRIKTLALDGVLPRPETILSGEYPHVVNLYAVTLKDNPNANITPFLNWMQGAQGQELIEKVGYVRLR
jgi:phosphate transport system substrate-binding protein